MSIKSGLDLYVVQLILEQHEFELCRSTSIRIFFQLTYAVQMTTVQLTCMIQVAHAVQTCVI